MSNVEYLPTTVALPPDGVLEGAIGKLSEVVVIGNAGDGFYLASSTSSKATVMWLLKQAEADLLDG